MGQIDFPGRKFYIQSKIGLSNWALTVENGVVKTRALQGSVDFLWGAEKDSRGGWILTHIGTGKVLTCQFVVLPIFGGIVVPSNQALTVETYNAGNSGQLWRLEGLGDPWRGINAFVNWELKINVYGSDVNGKVGLYHWDGGAPNEEWILVEETSQVQTLAVHYRMDLATVDRTLPPTFSGMAIEDNLQGAVPLTGHETLTTSITTTRNVTNSTSDTNGRTYTESFGVSGGLDSIFTVSASGSIEQDSSHTISFSEEHGQSKTDGFSKTVDTNVPAGKKYGYQLLVHYGKVDVPYTADMKFQSVVAGSAPVLFTSQGVYTGVNQTLIEVAVSDLTTKPNSVAESLVERMPISPAKAAGA